MVLVWRITDDWPNSPTFPPAKVFLHTVYILCVIMDKVIFLETGETLSQLLCMSNSIFPLHLANLYEVPLPKCERGDDKGLQALSVFHH